MPYYRDDVCKGVRTESINSSMTVFSETLYLLLLYYLVVPGNSSDINPCRSVHLSIQNEWNSCITEYVEQSLTYN